MLKHIVFMKFKPETSDERINDLQQSLAALPAAIPEIKEFVFGQDVVHSERSYDFALVSAFESMETMQRYQVHPDHQVVIGKVRALCDGILAVDFEY